MSDDRICLVNDEYESYIVLGDSYADKHCANNSNVQLDLMAIFDDCPEYNNETSLRVAMESSLSAKYQQITGG